MPRLVQKAGCRLESYLDGTLMIFFHRDMPGVIGQVGNIFGRHQVNIAQMSVGRPTQPAGRRGDGRARLGLGPAGRGVGRDRRVAARHAGVRGEAAPRRRAAALDGRVKGRRTFPRLLVRKFAKIGDFPPWPPPERHFLKSLTRHPRAGGVPHCLSTLQDTAPSRWIAEA